MDETQAVLTPVTEPAAGGRMSLSDSVKSAVRSSLETERNSRIDDAPQLDGDAAAADTDPMADAPTDQTAPVDAQAAVSTSVEPSVNSPQAKDQTKAADTPSASPASLEAPKQWSKAWREKFDKLPPEAKEILLDRDREYNKGFTKNAQDNAEYRRRSEALSTTFQDHHRKQMQSTGLDEVGAVKYLLQQHDSFNNDPVGFVAQVASQVGAEKFLPAVLQRMGVTPDKIGLAPQSQPTPVAADPQNEWVDPQVLDLKNQLAEYQKKLGGIEQFLQQSTQTATQREQAQREAQQRAYEGQVVTEIEHFVTSTDDQGNLLYPHVEDVQGDMALLIANHPEISQIRNPRERMEAAYNRAVYLNPQIRDSVIEAAANKARAEAIAQKEAEYKALQSAQAAQRARTAATLKGSPGANGIASSTKRMTIDEAVRAAVRSTR
jgi:hypothetical protein